MGIYLNGVPEFFSGATMVGSWVVGVFFFKYWTRSKDRLFFMFALSFWIMALERLLIIVFTDVEREEYAYFYLFRLCAFFIILVAIADKNRESSRYKSQKASSATNVGGKA